MLLVSFPCFMYVALLTMTLPGSENRTEQTASVARAGGGVLLVAPAPTEASVCVACT